MFSPDEVAEFLARRYGYDELDAQHTAQVARDRLPEFYRDHPDDLPALAYQITNTVELRS